jgi:hypothetical protein
MSESSSQFSLCRQRKDHSHSYVITQYSCNNRRRRRNSTKSYLRNQIQSLTKSKSSICLITRLVPGQAYSPSESKIGSLIEMSGGNAEKRRYDEMFDFKNVTPVKYVTGERTEKLEMEWEVRNFLTALAMSSDADSPGDGNGPAIRMTFESGKSVS